MFKQRGIRASIFLTVGPDNMGRHVRRMIHPAFALKMLRSRAGSIYGWDILLRGTLWPGPVIHRRLGAVLRAAAAEGHEIGTHAWDHHWWQAKAHTASHDRLVLEARRAHEAIAETIGQAPTCAAAPGWRCTPSMLTARDGLGYTYVSDCRGHGVFQPDSGPPQICVNLPTWDEAVGRDGITNETFNQHVIDQLVGDGTDVLTIHAESEGGAMLELFDGFLDRAAAAGIECVPLGDLIPESIPHGTMQAGSVPGREGWVAVRGEDS